jgi:hypothetical protein
MILEGLVTTLGADDRVNVAPMGPVVPDDARECWQTFELRPFNTSQTAANLLAHPEGVLHVHDDVLLLAQAAIGPVEPLPTLLPASKIRGWLLADACRALEFRIVACDDSKPRLRLRAEVVHTHRLRDFFGLNRAMFAVVEAAILATRTHLIPPEDIAADFRRLAVLIDKTGGPRERAAFELLQQHVRLAAPPSNS